ncbi:cyclophane-forming radical SAM/SPASM peptide maturase YhhB [Cupriavidus sp. CV2]|uniref:cyclophane-forming radical SAM/SPASM peptide maturase YhhB n=1 Tax=Cupriavidus ulmosensis TaxID=3065913 RepID=UPI00296B4637|nr:cyclophane-forming radical SAM/SPASM peptide maturase YhhB [Cupriavidus sp. CV2]MDW3681614.1 cyclophane-forming radical SAM/SPASM peptide maturase YhhB [Cupriavidus sp. CV2]
MNSSAIEVDTVLLKVASRCNIDCRYCYVYNMGDDSWRNMPALMSDATIEAVCCALGKLRQDQRRCFAVVLHGGEPLMMGARRLEHLLQSLRSVLPQGVNPLSLQTNGILITPTILDICAKYGTSLSVSLDGPQPINDRFRIGKRGEGTHNDAVRGIQLLRDHLESDALFSGVLAVINPLSSPREVYQYLKGLGAPSIDFLYRDGNHTTLPFAKASFESTEYAEWLVEVLDVYLADAAPPRIRFLDDLIKLCLGGRGVKEGSGQMDFGIAIIDSDGSVTKNDTLKSTYNGADRFRQTWSVHTHRLSEIFASQEFKEYFAIQRPTSQECRGCADLAICGGGMPLHRWREGSGLDNPSIYCADQRHLIGAIRLRLQHAGLSS